MVSDKHLIPSEIVRISRSLVKLVLIITFIKSQQFPVELRVNVRYLADDAGVLLHPLPRDLEPGVAAGGGVPDASEVVHAVLQPEIPVGAQARRTRIETQKKKRNPLAIKKRKRKSPGPLTSRRAPASS